MKTSFQMAQRCAHLMGGNGLSTAESTLLIAHELANWKEERLVFEKKGVLHAMSDKFAGTHAFNSIGADSVARERGHQNGEQLVKLLQKHPTPEV